MYLERSLRPLLERAAATFPAVLVSGPRQSGKTTLLRTAFARSHRYVSLEASDLRERAEADPRGFLADHPPPVILDEIQHVPRLLTYIQTAIDEDRRPGRWLLSGSQSFPLLAGASESLAGRVALLSLLPLSLAELAGHPGEPASLESYLEGLLTARAGPGSPPPFGLVDWVLRGAYPELWARPEVDRRLWLGSYIQTYLERDVRGVLGVRNLGAFQRFLRLAALRTGQVLNATDLARDVGVSPPTIREWLSVLEASHQILLLQPYFENLGKRLIKAPKLYFLDTGVATFLAGLHDAAAVLEGPLAGALFETAVVAELAKAFSHRGLTREMWFWRVREGTEVDLLLAHRGRLLPLELKLTRTPRPALAAPIARWREEVGERAGAGLVVCQAEQPGQLLPGVRALPWWCLGA